MSRLVCNGVASSLLFSVFQNIGTAIVIMTISGITLPFMSYGRRSILANFISVDLVLSLGMKKSKINF
ncbi:FtsW/RodA/SpoVE family cell cycle protein [Candidatus Clostridium radicumherbarum]|uniref:FtsW/RodA/SpoVE family cell cycle protein n=1 Tax=Candidatus Clostridium radicumherbarum TaxID=3381662 RepID=A0ABW8TT35_9CLOT